MFLPSIWASSSLPNTSVQDASALHLGCICTANIIVQNASALISGPRPRCQILSSGCFYLHFWAPSSLPNASVQDDSALYQSSILTANTSVQAASALNSGLYPHCQIPQFRMRLPSTWAPSTLPNTSVQDVSAFTSRLHPHCRICWPLIYRWCVLSDTTANLCIYAVESRRMKCNHCLYIAKGIECIFHLFKSSFVVMMYSYIH